MNTRSLPLLVMFVTLLGLTDSAWSGAPAGGVCFREQHLAHVCSEGQNNGQQCTVSPADNCDPVTPACPGGLCVVDYTTPKAVRAEVTIMFDKKTSTWAAPQVGLGPALTVLVCVRKKVLSKHCFTETYRLDRQICQQIPDAIYMGTAGCIEEHEVGELNVTEDGLIILFRYFVPEGHLNPDGDLAQGLRDLYGTTGIPVVTDFRSPGKADDHTGDNTGSVAFFIAILKFVSAVSP